MDNKQSEIKVLKCPLCEGMFKAKVPTQEGLYKMTCPQCQKAFRMSVGRVPDTHPEMSKPDSHVKDKPTEVISVQTEYILGKARLVRIRSFFFRNVPYFLRQGTTMIGREDPQYPSNISISGDSAMSRQSVEIIVEQQGWGFTYRMRVVRSVNPVYKNAHLVSNGEERYLKYGDILKIGNTRFRLEKV